MAKLGLAQPSIRKVRLTSVVWPTIQSAMPSKRNTSANLGEPGVISGLVSAYMIAVMEVRHEWHVGRPGAKDPVARTETMAAELARTLQGDDPDFELPAGCTPARMRAWAGAVANHRNQLAYPGNGTMALAMFLAELAVAHSIALEEKTMPDAEVDEAMRSLVVSVERSLLGWLAQVK